ncbi:MAG: alkane 1-monooxygenase [Saprospiraceae bacterium]|nr:alkane 1-monooxygenase [Saprospiraceae bacterium]
MKDLKYLAAYLLPFIAIFGLLQGGSYAYVAVIFIFGIVPVIELFAPNIADNDDEEEKANKLANHFFDWLLYLNVPIIYGTLGVFIYVLNTKENSTYELIGYVLSVGLVLGSCGINVGHELGHRNSKLEQLLAKLLLLPSHYTHFFIEHNRGHHKYVATEKDPASARKNENLYAFWLRSTVKGYQNAWYLEHKRLAALNISFWSWHNEMLVFTSAQIAYLATIALLTHPTGWLAVVCAGVFGFLLLETINYVEHYGLRRKLLPNGRYERVLPIHSWNSNYFMGRIMLYELTRHSDHHFLASKKYQTLDHHDDSPELPLGYPACMLMAFLPPLWFAVMNKRIPHSSG